MKNKLILLLIFHFSITCLFSQNSSETVDGNNSFAFDLYKRLQYEKPNENLFFSPFSISTSLSMVYAGAKQETQAEMAKVLHFNLNQPKLNSNFYELLNTIERKNEGVQLSLANSLWAQKNYVFLTDYINSIKQNYNTSLENVDFIDKDRREKARIKINNWVEAKTNNKIKDIIGTGVLNEDTRFVLVNAVYFLGKWKTNFKKQYTSEGIFYTTNKNELHCNFMKNSLALKYFESEKLQAVEIPYKDSAFSIIVILPKNEYKIEDLETTLTYNNYASVVMAMKKETVDLSIPKFKSSCELLLTQTLLNMGMFVSFSDTANFSGMTGKLDLKINAVIHKAFIDIDEDGTEAAAATVTNMIVATSARINKNKIFKANHPFIYLIKEENTGSILFMGKMLNPKE